MIFNSVVFGMFLPVVFLLYWFVFNRNLKLQNLFIIIASYFFYGWWDCKFLVLIAFTTICSYLSGLAIESARTRTDSGGGGDRGRSLERLFVAINIIINLGILATFKYYDFFVTSFASLFSLNASSVTLNLILPVGISFYTFQALSYSIDVYRGKIAATHDLLAFFAYVSFFPQLVAGPIERATNLLPQFLTERRFDYAQAVDGCRQMLWGFFKKVVVADNCAIYVDKVFSDYTQFSGSSLLLAAIFFAIQIYGDFSGYSDIAIGCSKLFGIRLMKNFNVPYFSRDIAEFWRRWHISLTTWFRDYLYIPLGGSRCSKAKIVRNTFVIFLVSGLWHGANWTYIGWGGYHACLFLPLILLGKNRKYTGPVSEGQMLPSLKELLQMMLTFLLAVVGWIIFRSETIGQALDYFTQIFDKSLFVPPVGIGQTLNIVLPIMVVLMFVVEWVMRNRCHGLDFAGTRKWQQVVYIYVVFMLIVLFSGKNETFIYFQF